MTKEERCEIAIKRGYTYNPETGIVYNKFNEEVNRLGGKYKSIGLKINKKTYNLKNHHFAWFWVYKEVVNQIDHIDRNKLNNKIKNLRSVTQQENNFNRSNVKGYTWNKIAKKWQAYIMLNKKYIYLGVYNTIEEAILAREEGEKIYHKI